MAVSPAPQAQISRPTLASPKFDINVGPKSHIFQPPRSPTPSRYSSSRSAPPRRPGLERSSYQRPSPAMRVNSDFRSVDAMSGAGKKRARLDSTSNNLGPRSASRPSNQPTDWSSSRPDPAESPAPFTNTQYFMKAEPTSLSTPTPAGRHTNEEMDEARFRCRWDSMQGSMQDLDEPHPIINTNFGVDSAYGTASEDLNYFRPASYYSETPKGGPITPWNGVGMVFNLVGRMWNFCRHSAFRGFHAGGGQGYHIKPKPQYFDEDDYHPFRDSAIWQDVDIQHPPIVDSPIPGSFPDFESNDDYFSGPPSKRLHVDPASAGWIMVDSKSKTQAIETPPSTPRLSSRRMPASVLPRPVIRNSPTSASVAGARRSLIPISRRATVVGNGTPNGSSGRASFASSRRCSNASLRTPSRPQHGRRVSSGNDRSPEWEGGRVSTPKSAEARDEARRYAVRRKKEEREQEERMGWMNYQLLDLIQQGRQALGAKVEVEYDVDTD